MSTMTVPELCLLCATAVMHGQGLTLTLPSGARWPAGFPRGELLSINKQGDKNVSFDPIRILAWMQKSTKAAQAVYGDFRPAMVTLSIEPTDTGAQQ